MSFTEYKHYFIVEYKYLLNVKYFWLNVNIKIRFCYKQGSSLILQHEYQTRATRMGHEWHTSDTSVTRRKKVGAIWATRVWHECYTNDTSATRVKNFDIDVWTFFSPPYIYYMASEWLPGEEQFHSKNYLLEMPSSNAIAFEKCTTKT